ncbi:hypothetical protein ACFWAT_17190 [Streptomyces syringium]|uniref:hypothetical protein n=1 Tax=Streptomyces syringium TaxID=76729 RepID=UPI003647EBBF
MQFKDVQPDMRVTCETRGGATGTVLTKHTEGFGQDDPIVCVDYDKGGEAWNYPADLSPLAPEDDERDPQTLPRMHRRAEGYGFWRGGTCFYVYRYLRTWRVMEWSDNAAGEMPVLVIDAKTRAAAVRDLIAKVDAETLAPVTVQRPGTRPALRPDMRVKAPSRGEGMDALGVVLTMRTPPADVAPGSVYVMWHLGAPSWIAAEELMPTGDLPGSPNLLDVEYGVRDGEGMFWRGGEEYRVIPRYSGSADGPWDVSHRAADGTLTRIVENMRTREAAHRVATTAVLGFEAIRTETVSYLAVAENVSGQPLRVEDAPGADAWGRAAAPTAELAFNAMDGAGSGLRYDAIKRRDVRNRISSVLVYPVRRDGSLGVPRSRVRESR